MSSLVMTGLSVTELISISTFLYVSNRILALLHGLEGYSEVYKILDPLLSRNSGILASFKKVTDVASSCQLSTLWADGEKVFFEWTGNSFSFH